MAKTYSEKKEELKKKYEKELTLIAVKRGMELDNAWYVLDTYGRGLNPNNPFIDTEELSKDCAELLEIAEAEAPRKEVESAE